MRPFEPKSTWRSNLLTVLVFIGIAIVCLAATWLLPTPVNPPPTPPQMIGCYTPSCGIFRSESTRRALTGVPVAQGIVDRVPKATTVTITRSIQCGTPSSCVELSNAIRLTLTPGNSGQSIGRGDFQIITVENGVTETLHITAINSPLPSPMPQPTRTK